MVQRLAPAFGSSDGYVQIVLNSDLPDEIIKPPWSQAGIKWYILNTGFTRYNASYFNLTPFRFLISPSPLLPLVLWAKAPLYYLYMHLATFGAQ